MVTLMQEMQAAGAARSRSCKQQELQTPGAMIGLTLSRAQTGEVPGLVAGLALVGWRVVLRFPLIR